MRVIRHLLRRLTIVLGVLLLALIVLVGWQRWHGNYHTVVPAELYRSGQLTAAQLRHYLEQHKLRSILNLRGAMPGKEWYEAERALAREYGTKHTDYKLSAGKRLDARQLDELVALMRRLPKPLLIHCEGGADRTSLASALYLYAIEGAPTEEAADQLSVRYGHFPYLFRSEVAAMDESFAIHVTATPSHSIDTP